MLRVLATPPPGSRPASLLRSGWPTRSMERRAAASETPESSRQRAEVAVLGLPPPVEVADDARQGHTGQAAQLRTGPLSTGSAAGSAATSARSRPGARSGCSRQYTTGPRSIARQPRTASMRGLGTVSRGETSVGARPACHPASGVSPRRNRPQRRLRRRGSPLAPSRDAEGERPLAIGALDDFDPDRPSQGYAVSTLRTTSPARIVEEAY